MHFMKFSQSLATPVYNALKREAQEFGRELPEHTQRLLTQRVIDRQTIATDDAERLKLTWHVVDQCVETAKRICRDGGFSEHITLEAIQQCTRDPSWLEDYATCIEDDVYKHGNPLKGPINRAIGVQIRAGIGGAVKKDSNGKPVMKRVLGEVIQSYTLFDAFDPEVVHGPGVATGHEMDHGQASGDSCLQGESTR